MNTEANKSRSLDLGYNKYDPAWGIREAFYLKFYPAYLIPNEIHWFRSYGREGFSKILYFFLLKYNIDQKSKLFLMGQQVLNLWPLKNRYW